MLEPEEHLHQFTTAAIAAAIGRAKRLTDLHCIHSSSVEIWVAQLHVKRKKVLGAR